jgi:hypothetical protein
MALIGGGSGGGGGIGSTSLVYRYVVSGSVKASIDTGVDAAQAGSGTFAGDLLELWLYARTDEAVVLSAIDVTFNNDTTAGHYTWERFRSSNATLTGTTGAGTATSIQLLGAGASADASAFSCHRLTMPAFAATVGFKGFEVLGGVGSTTAGNNELTSWTGDFGSTAAVSRVKVAPTTAAKNFAIGTELLIYSRAAS